MELQVNKGHKQPKKATNGQLERRLKNAVLHIDRTSNTRSIFFDDKGMRLTVNEDYAVIATSAHQHVFHAITPSGISRPYLYTKRLVEIALQNENDSMTRRENGETIRSYYKLLATLKEKDDKKEYNLCWFIDLWLNNIFMPLYSIAEDEASAFMVYEQYLHDIAKTQVLLSEHTEDMTNLQFVNTVIDNEKKYLDGLQETVILHKKTDEEKTQGEINALQEAMIEQNQKDNG